MRKITSLKKKERRIIIDAVAKALKEDRGIEFAYIFGSFIEDSVFRDIDIGIYLKNTRNKNLISHEAALAEKIAAAIKFPVDIIDVRIINSAPSIFLAKYFQQRKIAFFQ